MSDVLNDLAPWLSSNKSNTPLANFAAWQALGYDT